MLDTPAITPAPAAVEATRWIAVACVLALIALGLAWELWLAPLGANRTWAIKVLPLCIPLAGLLRRRLYTYRWVSLLVWLYVMEAALRITDAGWNKPLAAAQFLLCIALFAACAVHVRVRLRNKAGA